MRYVEELNFTYKDNEEVEYFSDSNEYKEVEDFLDSKDYEWSAIDAEILLVLKQVYNMQLDNAYEEMHDTEFCRICYSDDELVEYFESVTDCEFSSVDELLDSDVIQDYDVTSLASDSVYLIVF